MNPLDETQGRFLDQVYGEGPLDDERAIYRRNMLANLHDALASAYPVVRRLVGEAFFREAAERFARAHPSRSGDLHRFGAELGDFLAEYPPAASLEYLPDVARLEWAVALALHAADPGRVDFEALSSLPEAERVRVRFRLQAGAHLLASRHPAAAIWEANQPGRDGTLESAAEPQRVLVHRDGLDVRVQPLPAIDWRFLEALSGGASVEALAEDPALSVELERLLVQWTANQVIDGFALPPQR